jgi:hypothetical protein
MIARNRPNASLGDSPAIPHAFQSRETPTHHERATRHAIDPTDAGSIPTAKATSPMVRPLSISCIAAILSSRL